MIDLSKISLGLNFFFFFFWKFKHQKANNIFWCFQGRSKENMGEHKLNILEQ